MPPTEVPRRPIRLKICIQGAAQARSTHNEAAYQYILALAALERITAGGFVSGLTPPLPCTNGH